MRREYAASLLTVFLVFLLKGSHGRYSGFSRSFRRIWGGGGFNSMRGGDQEGLTLDEKVQNAMKKLGLATCSDDGGDIATKKQTEGDTTTTVQDEDLEGCKDGVCAVPTKEGKSGNNEEKTIETEIELDGYELAQKIADEMNVHASLAMAALGATSTEVDNAGARNYNEQAARDLIQQELDVIKNVSEESQEVQQLVSEGYDPFLCRRALAFAEMNMEDARAILIADKMDEEEEEAEKVKTTTSSEQPEQADEIGDNQEEPSETPSNMEDFKTVTVESTVDPTKIGASSPVSSRSQPSLPSTNVGGTAAPPGMPEPAKKADVVFEATSAQVQELVLESPVPVLLDIYADWCGPCKVLGPALEEMAVKAGGIFRLVKVNSDNEKAISTALEVTALPTVFGIRDGKIVHMFQGMPKSEDFMKNFMMGLLMPAGLENFDPPVSDSDKAKYMELSSKLTRTAGAACFPFAAREALQDRVSLRMDDLIEAHGGDLTNVEGTVKIIRSLLSNVIQDPYAPKFRKINLANKVLAAKVANFAPAVALLRILGFTAEEDKQTLILGKGKKVVNIAPLTAARDYLDKWVEKNRYELAAAARKRKDEIDRMKLLEAEAANAVNKEDDEEEEKEEIDPNLCRLQCRLDGKKKVHDIVLNADDSLRVALDKLPGVDKNAEDIQITCVAKRLIVKSSDSASMEKSIREHGLMPSASIVVKILSENSALSSSPSSTTKSSLSERAAAQKNKKKGSHTMQSIGIYAKDDNNKAELIDGGGGVWYEHDVTDDEAEDASEQESEQHDVSGEDEKND